MLSKDFGRISWLCQVDDLDGVAGNLEKAGLGPAKEDRERFGKRVLTYLDPEGNPFQVIQRRD